MSKRSKMSKRRVKGVKGFTPFYNNTFFFLFIPLLLIILFLFLLLLLILIFYGRIEKKWKKSKKRIKKSKKRVGSTPYEQFYNFTLYYYSTHLLLSFCSPFTLFSPFSNFTSFTFLLLL